MFAGTQEEDSMQDQTAPPLETYSETTRKKTSLTIPRFFFGNMKLARHSERMYCTAAAAAAGVHVTAAASRVANRV